MLIPWYDETTADTTTEANVGHKVTTVTRHKPQREDQKAKENADLKRENHKLARQLARAEKMLTKALGTSVAFTDPSDDEPDEVAEKPAAKGGCPECGGKLRRLSLGPKTFDVCESCKWRKSVTEPS